jgi:hypothetical protein
MLHRLQAAGIGLLERAAILKKIFKRVDEGLDATKVSRASFEGRFLDERVDTDHFARSKFAEIGAPLIGVSIKGPVEQDVDPNIVINILQPEWSNPVEVTVSKQENKE